MIINVPSLSLILPNMKSGMYIHPLTIRIDTRMFSVT